MKQTPTPPDPFAEHKAAWRRLSEELANYTKKLVPELESILSAKALVSAQAEEETDLTKLDALCIRLRSLEVRQRSASVKSAESEKAMQAALPLHIERDQRLAARWDELRLAEALAQLRAHFAGDEPELVGLAPRTTTYLEGRIKIPPYSYAWAQPLEPVSDKRPVLGIVDPIFCPPKREDTVRALLETTGAVLAVEEKLFAVLAGDERIPSFEAPKPPANETHPEWNEDLYKRALTPEERLAMAQAALNQQVA
jgi:hypothetical protein